MRVAFRVDAGPLIGGGHAMRCLTLADALAKEGAETVFVTSGISEPIAERIAASGHPLVQIPPSAGAERSGPGWHSPPLKTAEQQSDARATGEAVGSADWMVVDHYLLDACWHRAARDFAARIAVIDDLANRPCDCDLLVDQNAGRAAGDYEPWVPAEATVLAGPHFALLRPEFVEGRRAALDRRRTSEPVRRILISMGTTDIGGKTATVVDQVLAAAPDCGLDIVIGEDAPSLDHVEELARRNKQMAIHKDSRAMAGLMRDADLAVGAAGVTALERCGLGLPSITLVVADNQRSGAEALERSEASVIANVETLGKALDDLISDPTRRARMSAAAFAITDGMGTSRVVQAMDDRAPRQRTPLSVRSATLADSEILWLWRNDPLMREMSKNRAPIIWEDHERWLATVLSNPCVGLYMADRSGEPVAMVRFDRKDDLAIVSTNVAPAMRGQGIGTAALKAACETYEAESRTAHLVAEVRHDNAASLRAFAAAGFRRMKSTDPKFATLMRETVSEGEAKGR